MSLLSDRELERAVSIAQAWRTCAGADINAAFPSEALGISPLDREAIQPASVDLCLGGQFVYWKQPGENRNATGWVGGRVIDPMALEHAPVTATVNLDQFGDTFDMLPGAFVLAHTVETVHLGACLAGQVYGKSSIGRLGLEVENAGYIDPGFEGQITLELKNTTAYTIRLTVGMPIAQMAVHRLSSPAVRPYGHPDRRSRYLGQTGATPSRYGMHRSALVGVNGKADHGSA